MKIDNLQIQELTDALCARNPPTENEIRQAMTLSYWMGRNDGSLEAYARMLREAEA